MKKLLPLWMLLLPLFSFSQVVYEDINNTGIYDFLDEMANLKVISLNAVVKPYSRHYIAEKLVEVREYVSGFQSFRVTGKGKKIKQYKLTKRQEKELAFYLQDYQLDGTRVPVEYEAKLGFIGKKNPKVRVALNPLGFHYKDSLTTLSIRPILGVRWMTNENAAEYRRYWGASMFGYIGKNFGFYANIRDNEESTPLAKPVYFTEAQGEVYKNTEKGAVNYSEMRGGIFASVKWGSLGIVNDRVSWGDNYHGANILSGKAPAFPSIQLHLNPVKWFDFNYMHGWLNSGVIDSTRSYTVDGVYRTVFRNKYIAANMFTFIPWKGLNLSFGNSIIYSDVNVNPLYLIPFLFYNAVDAVRTGYNDPASSNSQMFFNISSRQIRYLHLYVSLFIDEWKMSRVKDPNTSNFTSLKAGFRLSNFPVKNLALTAEYTRTQPMTYDHYISTTTFASNEFCLGHYLRENSQEIYVSVDYRPIRGLLLHGSYTLAQHGGEYRYLHGMNYPVDGIPFLEDKTWQNSAFEVTAQYEFINNSYFFLQYQYADHQGDVKYNPLFMRGKTNTFTFGVNVGI